MTFVTNISYPPQVFEQSLFLLFTTVLFYLEIDHAPSFEESDLPPDDGGDGVEVSVGVLQASLPLANLGYTGINSNKLTGYISKQS